jgi:hypothetical protein
VFKTSVIDGRARSRASKVFSGPDIGLLPVFIAVQNSGPVNVISAG